MPVTHAEVADRLGTAAPDPVTLYRTLRALVDAGLAHRVPGPDGAARYAATPPEVAGCPGNHLHFLCTSCGAMTCLVDQPMPRVQVPPGVRVQTRSFLATGLCAHCAAAAGQASDV